MDGKYNIYFVVVDILYLFWVILTNLRRYSIKASMTAFQAVDAGSIPATCFDEFLFEIHKFFPFFGKSVKQVSNYGNNS